MITLPSETHGKACVREMKYRDTWKSVQALTKVKKKVKNQALTEGLKHTSMRRLPKGATALMLPETPFLLTLSV